MNSPPSFKRTLRATSGEEREALRKRYSKGLSRPPWNSKRRLRGKDSNLDYLVQSQASYH